MKIKYGFLSLGVIIVSASGCGVDAGACESAAFPDAPEGASGAVYVASVCSADAADGSREHPFSTIAEGISAAAPGAAVLVAPGTYAEALTIDKSISLVGSSNAELAGSAAVIVRPPVPKGITVTAGDSVRIRGVVIQDAKEAGIRVSGGSVTVEGCRIENTKAGDSQLFGFGIAVGDEKNVTDSSIIIQHSAITGSASHAVLALNARAIIIQNEIKYNGGYGIALGKLVDEGRVEGNEISNNTDVGVSIASSRAIIIQNTITGTTVSEDVGMGYGVYVGSPADAPTSPADVTMQDNVVQGNGRLGVLLGGGSRTIIIQRNKINDNGFAIPTGPSAGLWMQGGAGADMSSTIDTNELSGNRFVGLVLTGDSHAIIIQNNTVSGTVMGGTLVDAKNADIGDGIGVFKGASARLTGNTVSKNARFGLILNDALGASTDISGNTFSDHDAYAIIVQNQTNAPATDMNTFKGNKAGDVDTAAKGTFAIWDKELPAP